MGEAFSKINVDILNKETGQLNSTYDILKQMADVYPQLTANQREYYTQLASGKRNANVLVALLSNWEAVEKAISNASLATGSASQEQQAYLDSIEGKINQLQSAWSELANSTVSSDLIKGIVDLGTALTKLMSEIGGANVALGLFATVLGAKGGAIPVIGRLADATVQAGQMLTGYTLKAETATAVTAGLRAAMQGIVVTAVLWAGSKLLDYLDELNVTLEEQREIVKDLSDNIKGLQSEYDTLISKDSLTDSELQRVKILENELEVEKRLYEIEQKRKYDSEFKVSPKKDNPLDYDLYVANESGDGYFNVNETMENFEKLEQKIADIKAQLAEPNADQNSNFRQLNKELDDSEEKLLKLSKNLTWAVKSFSEASDSGYDFSKRAEGMGDAVIDFINSYNSVVDQALSNGDELKQSADNVGQSYMELSEIMESLSKDTELVSSAYKEMSKSGELTLDTVMQIINAGGELLDVLEVQDGQYKINMDTLEGLFEQDKAIAIERVKNAITQTKAQIDSAKAEIEAQSLVQEASKATLETNVAIAKANLGVAQSFVKSLGVQSIALGAFGSKLASDSVSAGNASTQQTKEAQAKLKDLEAQLKKYEVTLKVLESTTLPSYSGAVDKTKSSTDKLKDSTDKLNDVLKEQEDILDNLVEKYDNTKEAIIEMIDAEIEALEKANDMLGSYDADNSLANKYNIFKDYLLKGLEEEMDGIEKAGEAEKKFWQDKIDALKAEQDANERNKQLEEARLKIQEAQDALARAELARNQLQKNTRVYKEGEGWVFDYDPSAVKKADEDIKDAQDKVQDAVDKLEELQAKFLQEDIIKRYQEQIDAIEKQTQAQIDSIQKQMDAMNELAQSWGNNSAEILEEILSQSDAQQWLEDFQRASDSERIAMLQEFSDSYKTNVDDVIASNQSEIEDLENLRSNFEQKYDDMKKQMEGFIVDEQFLKDFENASYEERQAMLESFTIAFQSEYQKQKDIVDSLAQEVQRLTDLSHEASRAASSISSSYEEAKRDSDRLGALAVTGVTSKYTNKKPGGTYAQVGATSKVKKYANGGLLEPLQTRTGLDPNSNKWFDGTSAKPELVLNNAQAGNVLGALASTNAGKLYNIANNPMLPSVNNNTNTDTTTIGSVNVYPQKGDDFEKVIRQARQMAQTKNR